MIIVAWELKKYGCWKFCCEMKVSLLCYVNCFSILFVYTNMFLCFLLLNSNNCSLQLSMNFQVPLQNIQNKLHHEKTRFLPL